MAKTNCPNCNKVNSYTEETKEFACIVCSYQIKPNSFISQSSEIKFKNTKEKLAKKLKKILIKAPAIIPSLLMLFAIFYYNEDITKITESEWFLKFETFYAIFFFSLFLYINYIISFKLGALIEKFMDRFE